jgi:hypothetical protein
MKALAVSKPPCQLERGELRRVPQNLRSWVVGYHICCPRCGYVSIALNGKDDLRITEDSALPTLSEPLRCLYCEVLMHLRSGEIFLEEDDRVRNIKYR